MTPMDYGWTRHGHRIPGRPQDYENRPGVARCGGASICKSCVQDCTYFDAKVVTEPIATEPDEIKRLREQVRTLKHQLQYANERNHERNVQLDALHFVWCDGGCYSGVHRFGDCHRPLTEKTVLAAERNTQRLRKWWNAARWRQENDQPGYHNKATKAQEGKNMHNEIRRFVLDRAEDVSGVSGTGVVAEGCVFSDGSVVLRWISEWPTSVVWHDRGVESLETVHGHNGRTRIVWLDDAEQDDR